MPEAEDKGPVIRKIAADLVAAHAAQAALRASDQDTSADRARAIAAAQALKAEVDRISVLVRARPR